MSNVIDALEENDIVTADDLAELTTEQFKDLNITIGLANKIKKEL